MMEWKKVLRQKKILAVLAVLFVFQIFFFLYSMQEKEEKVNQADSMNVISIFAQEDSFSSRNLELTKKDFEGLLSVRPIAFEDTFLKEFFHFPH